MSPDKESQSAQLLERVAEREVYQFPGRDIRGVGFPSVLISLGLEIVFTPHLTAQHISYLLGSESHLTLHRQAGTDAF